jgi:hypothetical protein
LGFNINIFIEKGNLKEVWYVFEVVVRADGLLELGIDDEAGADGAGSARE